MNNEQTQAEKLAEEVWLFKSADDLIRYQGRPSLIESDIVKAITQATAELRAENERLTSERDQAQAQVAVLREIVKFYYESDPAIKDTQATADAFTAKARRDAIEEVASALADVSCDYDADGGPTIVLMRDVDKAIEALLPEPAEAAEKGGA